jgi:hypothetical protein
VEPLSETENDSFSHESRRWKVNETEALPASLPFIGKVFEGSGWGLDPWLPRKRPGESAMLAVAELLQPSAVASNDSEAMAMEVR